MIEFMTAGGVVQLVLSVEDAEQFGYDVRAASQGAERVRVRLRGEDKWRTKPIEGRDAFEVRWRDEVATFVVVVCRREWRCYRCDSVFPSGTRMYRQEGASVLRWRGGKRLTPAGAILGDMSRHVCRACMSPLVEAADMPRVP